MLETLINWDKELVLAINGAHAPWLDSIMIAFSVDWSFVVYLPVLYILYKHSNLKNVGLITLGTLVTFTLTETTATRLFKNNFERLRPCHNPDLEALLHLPKGCGGQFGFVSSHAANHFGLAMFFALVVHRYYPKAFPWFMVFPLIVIYSRVYLGKHYPSDVICGGIIGALLAYLVYRVINKWLAPKI